MKWVKVNWIKVSQTHFNQIESFWNEFSWVKFYLGEINETISKNNESNRIKLDQIKVNWNKLNGTQ